VSAPRTVAAIAAAILLAACAAPDNRMFTKPGTNMQDLRHDGYECMKETRQVERSFGYGYDRQAQADNFVRQCMYARGWVLQ